jgi:hypothetical protein
MTPRTITLLAGDLEPGHVVQLPAGNRIVRSIERNWAEATVTIEWEPSGFTPNVRFDREVTVLHGSDVAS